MAGPAIAGWIAIGAAGRAAAKKYGALIARKLFPKLFKKKGGKPSKSKYPETKDEKAEHADAMRQAKWSKTKQYQKVYRKGRVKQETQRRKDASLDPKKSDWKDSNMRGTRDSDLNEEEYAKKHPAAYKKWKKGGGSNPFGSAE